MYQYDSKSKTQLERTKTNVSVSDKGLVQAGIKIPMPTKSLFSLSFNAENLRPITTQQPTQRLSVTPFTTLQMQSMPQLENKELQPLPTKTSEEYGQFPPMAIKPNNTGVPLQMKEKFENLSGFSFDDVRVHYNSDKPAQLQALAYTQGNQVYVGSGQEKHLAHELGHVVQQMTENIRSSIKVNLIEINNDRNLETDADLIAHKALQVKNHQKNADAIIQRRKSCQRIVQRQLIRSPKKVDMNNLLLSPSP